MSLGTTANYSSNESWRRIQDFRHAQNSIKTAVIIITIISLLNIILNIFAMIRLAHQRRQTRPHYEAREILLISLCITDWLNGMTTVLDALLYIMSEKRLLHQISTYTMHACKFSGFVAILHIIAITIERYLSVRSPVFHRNQVTHKRAIIAVIVIWLLSATPIMKNDLEWRKSFVVIVSVAMLIADVIILFSYGYILHVIVRQIELQEENSVDDDRQSKLQKTEKRATMTFFFIVISTLLCTLPPAVYFLTKSSSLSRRYTDANIDLALVIILLALRGMLDPLVYIFRDEFCRCLQWKNDVQHWSYWREQSWFARQAADMEVSHVLTH